MSTTLQFRARDREAQASRHRLSLEEAYPQRSRFSIAAITIRGHLPEPGTRTWWRVARFALRGCTPHTDLYLSQAQLLIPVKDLLNSAPSSPASMLKPTGDIVEWNRLEGAVTELFDVHVLPGVRRPTATGCLADEIHRAFTIEVD